MQTQKLSIGIDDITNEVDKLLSNDDLFNQISKLEIKTTDKVLKPQSAWSFNGTTMGTLGNFSLLIGKAKSKKSFTVAIAISAMVKGGLFDAFTSELPKEQNKVLYFDTEQSVYHAQLALKRIETLVEGDLSSDLKLYGMRALTPLERLKWISLIIQNTDNIGVVVIDGIKDLVTSINDEEQATNIASWLLKITEENNIHIITVLHQNKGDNNARGHLGTELVNKSEAVYSVTKSTKDKDCSIVEAIQCRGKEPNSFAFSIDKNGLPYLTEYQEEIKKKIDILEVPEHDKFKVIERAFSKETNYSKRSLVSPLSEAIQVLLNMKFGSNKILKFIDNAIQYGYIIKDEDVKKGGYSSLKLGVFK